MLNINLTSLFDIYTRNFYQLFFWLFAPNFFLQLFGWSSRNEWMNEGCLKWIEIWDGKKWKKTFSQSQSRGQKAELAWHLILAYAAQIPSFAFVCLIVSHHDEDGFLPPQQQLTMDPIRGNNCKRPKWLQRSALHGAMAPLCPIFHGKKIRIQVLIGVFYLCPIP